MVKDYMATGCNWIRRGHLATVLAVQQVDNTLNLWQNGTMRKLEV
jgi:hypothetical protein